MTPVLSAAAEIQSFCQHEGWSFCIIGGLAVLRWGKPRTTQDVDVTLITGFGGEEPFVDKLLAHFVSRRVDGKEFALQHRVLLLRTNAGIGIDIALAGLPYEEQVVKRATLFEFEPGLSLTTASAEDIVVLKAFAGRPQDWADVQGILRVQEKLDWQYIVEQLGPLCELKESPGNIEQLLRMRGQQTSDDFQ
jgi:hypothetical protein